MTASARDQENGLEHHLGAEAELHARLALAYQRCGRGLVELAETSLREAEKLRSATPRAEELVAAAQRQAG